jgi:hypothetical protein
MKFYWTMPSGLKIYYLTELEETQNYGGMTSSLLNKSSLPRMTRIFTDWQLRCLPRSISRGIRVIIFLAKEILGLIRESPCHLWQENAGVPFLHQQKGKLL